MGLPALDKLVRIGQLKSEPRNALEVKRTLDTARFADRWCSEPGPVPTLAQGLMKSTKGYV